MSVLEFGQHSFALLRSGLGGDRKALTAFCDLFSVDARLWLPPTPNTHSPYQGREAIRHLLCDFIPSIYKAGLQLRLYQVLTGTERVLFQFEDRGTRQDDSDYQSSPSIALGVRGQKITGFGEVDEAARDLARQALDQLIAGMGGSAAAMDGFLALLSDDVRLWFPPTPNTHSPYVGPAEARRLFCDFLMKMYPQGMRIEAFAETSGGTRTAFELQSHGIRADGSEYVNSPCLCLDVKAGKIQTLWEHWGGPGFHRPLASR
jgi:ketosteroid isomerase-like protein